MSKSGNTLILLPTYLKYPHTDARTHSWEICFVRDDSMGRYPDDDPGLHVVCRDSDESLYVGHDRGYGEPSLCTNHVYLVYSSRTSVYLGSHFCTVD